MSIGFYLKLLEMVLNVFFFKLLRMYAKYPYLFIETCCDDHILTGVEIERFDPLADLQDPGGNSLGLLNIPQIDAGGT